MITAVRFSPLGLCYLLALFAPNLLWIRHKPKDYDRYAAGENRLLLLLERAGQALVCCAVLAVPDVPAGRPGWLFLSLLLGAYQRNLPLLVSGIILGVGHIGIHLEHKKELER